MKEYKGRQWQVVLLKGQGHPQPSQVGNFTHPPPLLAPAKRLQCLPGQHSRRRICETWVVYTKRVQIIDYGPINQLDIAFPFDSDDTPKPIVLVGENGSGKSILLSLIVNGLISAQSLAYPSTPEVEKGKVYKLRSNSYIRSGRDLYFAKVDFESDLRMEELGTQRRKQENASESMDFPSNEVKTAWDKLKVGEPYHFLHNFSENETKVKDIFSNNCVLYFPPNRFEEPAWLNEENLKTQAEYMNPKHLLGYTSRRVINYSSLRENQNWLFEVAYDRAVLEIQTLNLPLPVPNSDQTLPIPLFAGYQGEAANLYNIALQVVQRVMNNNQSVRFGIGPRHNRVVTLEAETGQIVPNVFQLSSGETSLLNLFLSILRDFDLCGTPFTKAEDVRGIVVVDEVDLHLHAVHQYTILPKLIEMFPRVQFVVTTHSPLFVLGMKNVFGEDGFALYRLPHGKQISPEEFSEFGNAYQAFTETSKFSDDIRTAIESAPKPLLFVEGTTNVKYLQTASKLLGKEELLERIDIRDGNGKDNLRGAWNSLVQLSKSLPQFPLRKVMLLFDCDYEYRGGIKDKGNLSRRKIPQQSDHPLEKGIENLFSKATLEKAREFLIITQATETRDGRDIPLPEKWCVNEKHKTNLCNWLCEHGKDDDFQHFQTVFDLLEEALD